MILPNEAFHHGKRTSHVPFIELKESQNVRPIEVQKFFERRQASPVCV